MRPALPRFVVPCALGLGLALTASSCGKPGPGPTAMYNIDGGFEAGLPMAMIDPTTGTWESSPWGDDGGVVSWIPYGPHQQLDLEHGLGRIPDEVLVYISFFPGGQSPSQAAGDLARIVAVTADRVIVWNDTNGSYYARVVVR
jgi:hypothetical protein